ncbi:MAG TPA: MlaD family protein [Niabella sp.]|nr:MlaD family protein [Niabella sp.]HOZ98151.1 MlaD family protein [Niabella sp.]HQW16178.1 MlaD family protein [Niabella sp.]HQX21390.1 MlaD family protein [Niabella sp.]HQX41216.1 MlaD family protein [Niabella sp.]
MKISNEIKVGILAIVAIVALIFGFRFLKSKDLFNHTPKIYAIFKTVGGLEKSNFVKINGLPIGSVYSLEPADENVSAVRVTLSITQKVNIPANSVAYIEGSLLGASNIVIERGDGSNYLADGDKIATKEEAGLLGDLTSEAKPLMSKVRTVADSVTLLLSNLNNILNPNTQREIQAAISNLNSSTAHLNGLMAQIYKPLTGTIQNLDSVTGNLKNQNKTISGILNNANTFTNNLKQLEFQKTIDSLNATITTLRNTVGKLSDPNGSIGAMMNDKKLYNKMNDVLLSAEILMDDLRVHPKRYVNISVFGKKNKSGELTAPAIKDSVPR